MIGLHPRGFGLIIIDRFRPDAAFLSNTHVSSVFVLDPLFAEHPAILPFLASGSKMQRMRPQKLSCILASVKVSLFTQAVVAFVFALLFFVLVCFFFCLFVRLTVVLSFLIPYCRLPRLSRPHSSGAR